MRKDTLKDNLNGFFKVIVYFFKNKRDIPPVEVTILLMCAHHKSSKTQYKLSAHGVLTNDIKIKKNIGSINELSSQCDFLTTFVTCTTQNSVSKFHVSQRNERKVVILFKKCIYSMTYYRDRDYLRLLARNEGRIKSYDSCTDIRAWSHDRRVRDQYLREWIKCDMPICVIPLSTFTYFLRIMTCRSRGRATPHCHPNCKSKVLLESICKSCHAMKECLKQDENFDKYFEEEEFETSHWPCERCLEALKSIKMFWKIIVEKLFNINISKTEEMNKVVCSRSESIKSLAKVWQSEMVHQALFVKNVKPLLTSNDPWRNYSRKETKPINPVKINPDPNEVSVHTMAASKSVCCTKSQSSKATNTNMSSSNLHRNSKEERCSKKLNKCISVQVESTDVGCDTYNVQNENEINEMLLRETNLQETQATHNAEIERLRQENNSLKLELKNLYKNCPWKSDVLAPSLKLGHETVAVMPQPFDSFLDERLPSSLPKDIDSEMIITMRNCKNENYRHVSLLQVLHKTNERISNESITNETCNKNEDPVYLLTKVQNTFGAMVRREMSLASERRHRPQKTDIEATFHRMSTSRSAPSCSTLSSYSSTHFMSPNKDWGKSKP